MQNTSPLNKVVFIQKVAAFINPDSLKDLFELAYVNNSWNDTMKSYSFHIFEARVRDAESAETIECVCDGVIKSGVSWFMDVLLFSKTLLKRVTLLSVVVIKINVSTHMIQLVLEKIIEAGGAHLLKSQLTATDRYGQNCLMYCCMNPSSPTEVLKLLCENIVEVGGKDLLQSQITATNKNEHGRTTPLMHCCSHTSSQEFMELVFEKIVEAGGSELLKNQLTATDDDGGSCLMVACRYSNSAELMKLLFEKIVEAGGMNFLNDQLTATDREGWTCVMHGCALFKSRELMKLLFEKIVEAGGTALLQRQITAMDGYGCTCLIVSTAKISSPEVRDSQSREAVKLLAMLLFYLDIFEDQYAKLNSAEKQILSEKVEIKDASWVPDPESIAEVKKMLKV